MKEILSERIEELKREIKQAYIDRSECSVETHGSYEIKIRHLKNEFNKISEELTIINSAVSPDDFQIFCFVLCSTLEEISSNLEKNLSDLIESDRYDSTDREKWKPYLPGDSINILLNEFSNYKGYKFQVEYINGNLTEVQLALIDSVKKVCFVIIDLLSINPINALVTQRFDSKETGGLVMPCCRRLHNDLKVVMDQIRQQYFRVAEYHSKVNSFNFYIYDVSLKQNFFQQLNHIFYDKFKIKNQINSESSVRGLQISM